MPNRRLNVFLCHAKEDKPTVRELYRQLTTEGWLDVWLDEENLFPGQEWDMEIEKAVEQADVVVVCLSTHSVDKEGYVQKELRFVLNIADEKPEGTLFVIPLRLDECVLPRRLRSWQYADYFPKEERARAYERLLVSLRMRAKRLGIPTVNPAEEQARKDAEEKARAEREERERKAAEEQARKEAQDKARVEEEQERKAAQERARLLAEQRVRRERVAREKKEADAKARKDKETRERKAAAEQAQKEAEKPQPEKVVEKPVEIKPPAPAFAERVDSPNYAKVKPPVRKSNLVPYGIGVIVILMFVCLGFGGNYLFQKIFPTDVPASITATWPPPSPVSIKTNTPVPFSPPKNTPTPPLGVGSTEISPKDGITMLFVPAGKFTMGSGSDEHEIVLEDFWIDKTEVTNAMFAAFLNIEGNQTEGGVTWLDSGDGDVRIHMVGNSWQADSGYEDHPAIEMSWFGAQAYCKWRGDGTRLPTEAEWEKAASWDDDKKEKRVYPWGDSIDCSFANYWGKDGGCVGETTKVGSYPSGASFYGLLDMAGNVWEWVSSLYQGYPYSSSDGREDLSASGSRVLRGGSWNLNDSFVRSSDRYGSTPVNAVNLVIGFRCARSLP